MVGLNTGRRRTYLDSVDEEMKKEKHEFTASSMADVDRAGLLIDG
jgi:hypothetical protein